METRAAASADLSHLPVRTERWAVAVLLLVAFGVRLIHLEQPLVERFVWRSVDNAAIARNFFAGDLHLAWPQVDWAGPRGYVETELPLQMWVLALGYRLLGGEAVWLGRLITVLAGMLQLGLFHRLARVLIGPRAALSALSILAFVPTSIFFSRNLQQDALMIAAQLGALLCGWYWLERTPPRLDRWGVGVMLCLSLGALIKPTALLVGLPLAVLVLVRVGLRGVFPLRRHGEASGAGALWGVALGALLIPALWYFHARLVYLEYGYTFGIFSGGHDKFQWRRFLTSTHWYLELLGRYLTWHLTVPGAALVGLGLLRLSTVAQPARALVLSWTLSMLAFVFLVAEGNYDMLYYQWVTLPPLALVAGLGVEGLAARVRGRGWMLALGTTFAASSAWTLAPAYQSYVTKALTLADAIKASLPPETLLLDALAYDVHNPGGYNYEPMTFYYSGHKGWGLLEEELSMEAIEHYRRMGAGALVTWRTEALERHPGFKRELEAGYSLVVDRPGVYIVRLGRVK